MSTVKLVCTDGKVSSVQVLDANDDPVANVLNVKLTTGVNDSSEPILVAQITIGPIAVTFDNNELALILS